MKKVIGIFITVLISIGIADVIQGLVLTWFYTSNPYTTSSIEMASFIRYMITAACATIALWGVTRVKAIVKSAINAS